MNGGCCHNGGRSCDKASSIQQNIININFTIINNTNSNPVYEETKIIPTN